MKNSDYQKICTLIENKVNEIFLEMQNELNIESGDIAPLDALYLEELQGKLANHIEYVLNFQRDDFDMEE